MASIQFLGAAGTVTGSQFLLDHEGTKILVDCGLFQGPKELRQRNWSEPSYSAKAISAVVLTHAHIDHIGALPRLVKAGFRGPVFCTPGTRELAGLLLPDSAHLQEEEAQFANKKKYSRHSPALPLYTAADAARALALFESFPYGRPREILPGVSLTFHRAGHILGSALCAFDLPAAKQRVLFSGDVGRYRAPILPDPEKITFATTLVVESTYGDREHGRADPRALLADAVASANVQKGMLIIPAFAIGRTQEILFHLRSLELEGQLPPIPIFIDSPMACDATPIFLAHPEDHDEAMQEMTRKGLAPLLPSRLRFVNSVQESQRINSLAGPGIIISASGMATGGRVLHHLKYRLPDPRNSVVFVGHQAPMTRGARLLAGEKEIKIHGQMIPVRARISQISGFSAHADSDELLRWLGGFQASPTQTFLVHGEKSALGSLQSKLSAKGWPSHIPTHLEEVRLV